MRNQMVSKLGFSIKVFILTLTSLASILGATLNYTTYFGPSIFSPGLIGSKTYRLNFNAPTGNNTQITSILSIKNGNGTNIVFEDCKRLQIACLLRNLLKEAEVLLLRPSSVAISINNNSVFSKTDYNAKQGIFEKTILANKSNTLEVKIQGTIFSSISISAKSANANLPPIADFTYTATDYIAPTVINFSGILSRDQDTGYISSYTWNFGDGSMASGSIVSHSYSLSGEYNVTLTVTDNLGASSSKTQNVLIKANQTPIANFSLNLTTALGDFTATVDGSKSKDLDGIIVDHMVDWGDGSAPETSESPIIFNHLYTSSGNFTVEYRVRDNRGATASSKQVALVEDKSPPVLVVSSPINKNTYRGNSIQISGESNEKLISAFADIDSQEISLKISPDGFTFSGSVVYANEGIKNIKIYALDRSSNISSVALSYTMIFNKMPLASFEILGIKSVGKPLEFNAETSTDSDGNITKYIWNFQDGSDLVDSSSPRISHTFSTGGAFNVALTVIDNEGGSSAILNSIFINTPPIPSFNYSSNTDPMELLFNASTTIDSDGDILTYSWNFGDGASGSGAKVSHLFTTPGQYQINLVVSDTLSNATISKNIVVSSDVEDENESTSPGLLVIDPEIEAKINPLNADLVFTVKNALLAQKPTKTIEVYRNGIQIISTADILNNKLILHRILESGKNEIEIRASDSMGRIIFGTAKIWAGDKTITMVPELSDNGTLSPPYKTKVFLADENEVQTSFDQLNASDLPDAKLVVIVEDSLRRIGTTVVYPGQFNAQVPIKLFPASQNISNDNNDFSEGLAGWSVSGGVANIIPHSEQGNSNLNDLDLSIASNEAIRVSRTIQSGPDQKTAWARFKFGGQNPSDSVIIIFRGLDSGKTILEYKNLENINNVSQPNQLIETGWIESSISNTLAGESIEMILITLPNNESSASAMKKSASKTSTEILFSTFVEKALAAPSTPVFVNIDYAGAGSSCVISSKFIDYSPTPQFLKENNDNIELEEKRITLQGLSVGLFKNTQLEGKNKIAARIKVCPGSFVYDWQIEAYVNSIPLVLGKSVGISPPIPHPVDQEYDVVFTLEEPILAQIKNNIASNGGRIDLGLYGFKDSLHSERVPVRRKTFQLFTRKDWPQKYRYTLDRGNLYGGDDWMTPWMNDLITEMAEFYENDPDGSFTFNDVSNMNGGHFDPHLGHNDGINIDVRLRGFTAPTGAASVESQNAMNVFFKLFKKHGNRIDAAYLTHSRPFLDDDDNDLEDQVEDIQEEESNEHFIQSEISFNRLRHECINNRLMRRVLTSWAGHKTHFHYKMKQFPISVTGPGLIDLKVSHGENGILKFKPEIFKWENNIRYEVYFEKELTDGYSEFVPLVPNVNPLGNSYGQIKLKVLKIARNGSDYSCSSAFETTFPEYVRQEDVEYIAVNLNPEGVCNGEYLKPVRGVFGDYPTSTEVGWVSPDAQLNKGNIGANAYLCAGSSLKSYSELFGGYDGLIEVKNSQISAATVIHGNVRVDNSNIDHADIFGPAIEGKWTPQTKFSVIRFAEITDLLNEPTELGYNSPNQIYGNVNILGNAADRVHIDRASLPIEAPDSPPDILGTQIISGLQEVKIYAASKISNSFISGRNETLMENKELSISEGSEILSSSIVGNIQISGNSKVTLSGIYPVYDEVPPVPLVQGKIPSRSLASVDMKISNATIASSTIGIRGEISGTGTKITNSEIRGNSQIYGGSIISDSYVYDATLDKSKISSSIEARNVQLTNSVIENSRITDSVINDSSVSSSSTVYLSTIQNSSTISSSQVSNSTIDSSKAINGANIDQANLRLDSVVENSKVERADVSTTTIANSPAISGGTISASHIETLKSVIDSNISKSNINQSLVTDSTIKESTLDNSDVRKSYLELSTFLNGAFAEESTSINSEVSDAQLRPLANVQNSKVLNKSTITDSFVRNGSEIDFSDIDSLSEVDSSKILGMGGIYRAGIRNSKVLNFSEVYYSYIENSTVSISKVTSSTLVSSLISNSTLLQVNFNDRNVTNSYCYQTINQQGFPVYECVPGNGPANPGGPVP